MTDSSPASARLQALIGEAIHSLSPHFVRELDRILAGQAHVEATTHRVVSLFGERHRAARQDDSPSDAPLASASRRSGTTAISRKLGGLSTIMQILEAAHHCRADASNDAVLSAHLVEGLLMAGRELFDAVDEELCGVR